MRLPEEGSLANQTLGLNEQIVYKESMESGLRFPLDLALHTTLEIIQCPLPRLHSNTYKLFTATAIICQPKGYTLIPEIFLNAYSVVERVGTSEYVTFQAIKRMFTGLKNHVK